MDCLDTGVLIAGLRSDPPKNMHQHVERARAFLLAEGRGELLLVPAIVLAEFLVHPHGDAREEIAAFFDEHCDVAPFDAGAASAAARLTRAALNAGRGSEVHRQCIKADVMIAGTALARGAQRIVTLNVAHFSWLAGEILVVEPPPFAEPQPLGLDVAERS